jgi:hypothetical protein
MTSSLSAGHTLTIDGIPYSLAEHPAAPGMPYGQEGRQAVVYQLLAKTEHRALKVFKPRYRLPALFYLGEQLQQYADLPGLAVCRRTVLTPQRHADVLLGHQDMIYAVLMPWIEGPNWMQVLVEKRELAPEASLRLARSCAHVLATMEQYGLAHCDLSGPNVMLPELAGGKGVALVDVEQMYSPEFRRPSVFPGGSPGYAHRMAPEGLWTEEADRFSGAVLLAEMLGWCDERVREAAWGENYFKPREMQRDGDRYRTLLEVLRTRWGEPVGSLFERAWQSDVLSECATLGEWLLLVPKSVPQPDVKAPQEKPKAVVAEAAPDLAEQDKPGAARQAQVPAQPKPVPRAKETRIEPAAAERKQEERSAGLSSAGTSTAQLFAGGRDAYERQEWGKAKELLAEVVRREPGYAKDGVAASAVLRSIERQQRLQGSRGWLVALALVVLAAIVWIAASMIEQSRERARARATATAVVAANRTGQARATGTVVAAANRTAEARAAATEVAQGTATARVAMTATAAELAAVASGTAEVQATQAAIAHATQAAALQQTSTAAAHSTGTAIAISTVTVRAAQSATAQAAGTATALAIALRPTRTRTPVSRAPQLIAPANGATFTGYVSMDFSWKPVAQALAADEYYALVITFQCKNGSRCSSLQASTKDTKWSGKLEEWLYNDTNSLADRASGWQHGWYVVVMRSPGMSNGQITGTEVSPWSEERFFTWKLEGASSGGPGPQPGQEPTKTPKPIG